MLNMTALLGAVPARFNARDRTKSALDLYFAMARGTANSAGDGNDQVVRHQLSLYRPGVRCRTLTFRIASTPALQGSGRSPGPWHLAESRADRTSDLSLSGQRDYSPGFNRLDLLPHLLPVYGEILARLRSIGVEWVQIDEPLLALDLNDEWLHGLDQAYAFLTSNSGTKLLLTTYFEAVDNHAERLKKLPVDGLHIDLCRGTDQLDIFLEGYPADKVLSLGIIDGRDVWRADLARGSRRCRSAAIWESDYGLRLVVRCCIVRWILSWRCGWTGNKVLAGVLDSKIEEISILGQGLKHGENAIRENLVLLPRQGRSALHRPHT